MKLAIIVGIGSFFGGVIRYFFSMFVQTKAMTSFPYGTFAVNLTGCFIIGCLFGLSEKWELSYEWRLLLTTGLLGGFTTFSAFSVETHYLLKTGHTGLGLTYVLASIVLGIGLTFLGAWLFRFDPTRSLL
jgi:fluoride exporter